MVGWSHWFNGHEFEQTLGDSDEQESLACCSPWGCKKVRHDLVTEQQDTVELLSTETWGIRFTQEQDMLDRWVLENKKSNRIINLTSSRSLQLGHSWHELLASYIGNFFFIFFKFPEFIIYFLSWFVPTQVDSTDFKSSQGFSRVILKHHQSSNFLCLLEGL